jgi:hypothetical protein
MVVTTELTHHEKKNIAHRIEQLKNKKHYKRIFQIVHENSNKYTVNDNGVYLNINTLSSATLIKIRQYLDDVEKNKVIIPIPNEYVPYSDSDSTITMSTQERHFMKRIKDDDKMTVWGTTENEATEIQKIDITPLLMD